MDIYCPACGKKGRIDDAKIPDSGTFARCPGCKKKLWINKADGVSLAEEPSPSSIPPQGEGSPASAPSSGPLTAPVPPAEAVSPHRDKAASGTADPPSQPATPQAPPVPPYVPTPTAPAQQPQPSTPSDPVPAPVPGPASGPAPEPIAGFEISPMPVTQAQPSTGSLAGEPGQGTLCSVCGSTFPDNEMVQFGEKMVCGGCKPKYVEMMRSGVARQGSFRYGGFWIRFVAKVIDGIILAIAQGIIITPLMIFLFKSTMSAPDTTNFASFITANLFLNLISVAMGATYTTLFIGKYQATPGKMAFGLKVVSPDGGRISYMRALGRHFAEMVSAFTLAIGYIMAGFDSQKRTLHDRICATRVIRN